MVIDSVTGDILAHPVRTLESPPTKAQQTIDLLKSLDWSDAPAVAAWLIEYKDCSVLGKAIRMRDYEIVHKDEIDAG